MTNAIAIGLALVYVANDGEELLVRITDLFDDHRRAVEWWIAKHGGIAMTVEPSLSKRGWGTNRRIRRGEHNARSAA